MSRAERWGITEADFGEAGLGGDVSTIPVPPRGLAPVLDEVRLERGRQDAKWGEQNHPDGTGPDVALGPVWGRAGDAAGLARDLCQESAREGTCTWLAILREEVFEAFAESDPAALRTELIQVAAVAVQWAEAIGRRG